jgi:hypothetical protein
LSGCGIVGVNYTWIRHAGIALWPPHDHRVENVLRLARRSLSEDIQTTSQGFWANHSGLAAEVHYFCSTVIASDDDLASGPSAPRAELTRHAGIPDRRPANGGHVFEDQRHVARAGVSLTLGQCPVIFVIKQGIPESGGNTDAAVRIVTGRAPENALI